MTHRAETEQSHLDLLFERVEHYRQSQHFFELMKMCSRFRHLNVYNAMLVNIQKPASRYVLREREWRKEFNRSIKPNAQPLVILVPFGPVDFLFEIGDTESNGKSSPSDEEILDTIAQPYKTKREAKERDLNKMMSLCAFHGIAFDMNMNAGVDLGGKIEISQTPRINQKVEIGKGLFCDIPAPYLISVNKQASNGMKLATIAHELGHLFCKHQPAPADWKQWETRNLPRAAKEFEAESVSWLICERLNIGNPSEEYLSHYLDKNSTIPVGVSVDTILKATNQIWSLCQSNSISVKEGLVYKCDSFFKNEIDRILKERNRSIRPRRQVF